jgi:hypothetical protein
MEDEASRFSQRGGVRLNFWNATWPFAVLSAESKSIRCSGVVFREVRFPKASVKRLSRYDGIFSVGLRIEHTVSSAPEFVVFWTFNFKKLTENLRRLGYEVME